LRPAPSSSFLLHFSHDLTHIQQSTSFASKDSIVHTIRFLLRKDIDLSAARLTLNAVVSMLELIRKEKTMARAIA
jgi:hypothetical protein